MGEKLLFTLFLLFISLKSLFMNNEQCQGKKKKKLKLRKEAKRGHGHESKPTQKVQGVYIKRSIRLHT